MEQFTTFAAAGFLSDEITRYAGTIRASNVDAFHLVEDLNTVLQRVVMKSAKALAGTNWTSQAVAVRLLMRSSASLQGAVMLAERGMVAQSRMLVRAIVEDSFCAAALLKEPAAVIKMLQDDAEAARRKHARFITTEKLGDDPAKLSTLEAAIDEMDAKATMVNQREMARIGGMLPQYLNYCRLSDDSVHTSAASLHKHVEISQSGDEWRYRLGPGESGETLATLHRAVLAALPVAIVVTQIMDDEENNTALRALSERLLKLPQGASI